MAEAFAPPGRRLKPSATDQAACHSSAAVRAATLRQAARSRFSPRAMDSARTACARRPPARLIASGARAESTADSSPAASGPNTAFARRDHSPTYHASERLGPVDALAVPPPPVPVAGSLASDRPVRPFSSEVARRRTRCTALPRVSARRRSARRRRMAACFELNGWTAGARATSDFAVAFDGSAGKCSRGAGVGHQVARHWGDSAGPRPSVPERTRLVAKQITPAPRQARLRTRSASPPSASGRIARSRPAARRAARTGAGTASPARAISAGSGRPTAVMSDSSSKKRSKPAGEMTSIMRAGVEPAFHIAWTSPRGLMM